MLAGNPLRIAVPQPPRPQDSIAQKHPAQLAPFSVDAPSRRKLAAKRSMAALMGGH
jgi:hypothetical protein